MEFQTQIQTAAESLMVMPVIVIGIICFVMAVMSLGKVK